jgi:replicative DNA helicase
VKLEIDALLPHDTESERALIGTMVISTEAIREAVDTLGTTGDAFYDPTYAVLYEAIVGLDAKNAVPDKPVLANYLGHQESVISGMTMLEIIGGQERLDDIFADAYTPQNAGIYAQSVRNNYIRRRIIRAGGELARLGATNGISDPNELLSQAEGIVYDIRTGGQDNGLVTSAQAARAFMAQMHDQIENPNAARGIKLGLPNLDALLGSIEQGRLITLAGRPGFGKTTSALRFALHLAVERQEPVLFVSYEQDEMEHMRPLLSMLTGIPSEKIKNPSLLTQDELATLARAAGQIERAPLYFMGIGDPIHVKSIAKRTNALALQKHGKPLAMVVVDYIQLMPIMPNTRAGTRDQEIGEISRFLKLMAKEMHLVVLMLAQLNRDVERRTDHRPMLADLRESGNIEQDSDIVVFVYCPWEYMDEHARRRDAGNYPPGYEPYEHIVRKWRAGRTGVARGAWNKSTADIISLTQQF